MKRLLFLFGIVASTLQVDAAPLDWWPNASVQQSVDQNYAPANLGQLKNMAKAAKAHMDARLPGGAGTAVNALVAGFGPDNGVSYTQAEREENYRPINLGQLKAVAKPFYDRLRESGISTKKMLITRGFPSNWASDYPWDPLTAAAANYGPANLGQLKSVFAFDARYQMSGLAAAGYRHGLAIKYNGRVTGWGQQQYGVLGNGDTTSGIVGEVNVLKKEASESSVLFANGKWAAAADGHSLVVDQDGYLWTFGRNHKGQLGHPSANPYGYAKRVQKSATAGDYLTGVVKADGGEFFSIALLSDKTVVSWGYGNRGRLGSSGVADQPYPVAVYYSGGAIGDIRDISAGRDFGGAVGWDKKVYMWGENNLGQLGMVSGTPNYESSAVKAQLSSADLTDVIAISCGRDHTAVIRSSSTENRTVWCWGQQARGQLGNGNSGSGAIPTPTKVSSLQNIIQVEAGAGFTLALDKDGYVWAWGENGHGELGVNTNDPYLTAPTKVKFGSNGADLSNVVQISAGGDANGFAYALLADGSLYTWGFNDQGTLKRGGTTDSNAAGLAGATGLYANPAPSSVILTVPGTTFTAPANISMSATAGDSDGIARVEFYRNSQLIGSDPTSPYEAIDAGLPQGTYNYSAIAYDVFGKRTVSNTVTKTVGQPTLAIQAVPTEVDEGDSTGVIRISRGSGTGSGALSGTISIAGTATNGTDYTSISTTFTIAAGQAEVNIPVVSLPDSLVEGNETVVVTLLPSPNYDIGGGAATLTIKDVAAPAVFPPANTIADVRVVRLTTTVASGQIRYTTNNTAPTAGSPVCNSGDLVRIPRGATLRAIAGNATIGFTSPELNVPFTGRAKVQAGEDFNAAISEDGYLWTWGTANADGQLAKGHTRKEYFPFLVSSQSGVVSASVSQNHLVFSRGDAKTFAAGANTNGRLGVPGTDVTTDRLDATEVAGTNQFEEVSIGQAYSLALRNDGVLYSWGDSTYGKLGNGTTTGNVLQPATVSGGSGYSSVAAGVNHSLGLTSSGALMGWGLNGNGQLGDNTTLNKTIPTAARRAEGASNVLFTDAVQVAAGNNFSVALSRNGTVWTAGASAQRGGAGAANYFQAVSLPEPETGVAVKVSAGYGHALVLKSDGTVCGWGVNASNQLKSGSVTPISVPEKLVGISNAVDISAGKNHSLILLADGSVVMLGKDSRTNPVNLAKQNAVPQLSPISGNYIAAVSAQVTAVSGVTFRYTLDGSDPTDASPVVTGGTVPIPSSAILKVRAFSATAKPSPVAMRQYTIGGRVYAGYGSTAIIDQGQVWVFGDNTDGKLGIGEVATQLVPKKIESLLGVKEIAFGQYHTLFLLSNDTVYMSGQLPSGVVSKTPVLIPSLSGAKAIAAGLEHSLILKSDGTVWGIGGNSYGQLGADPLSIAYSSTLVQIPGLTGIISIAASGWNSFAISADGTVWTCGYHQDSTGIPADELLHESGGIPTPAKVLSIRDAVAISGSNGHSMVVRNDGSVWTSGTNFDKQLGAASLTNLSYGFFNKVDNVTNAVGVAAGNRHSLIVDGSGNVWACGSKEDGRLGTAGTGSATPTEGDPFGFSGQTQITPAQVQLGAKAISVSADEQSAATRVSGRTTYWVWGDGSLGQLGDGFGLDYSLPRQIAFTNGYSLIDTDLDGDGISDWWETYYFGLEGAVPNADSDGDGLSNYTEFINGTNPLVADSDGDGIDDGLETATIASKADTDSDLLPDKWEQVYGPDPLVDNRNEDPDADGFGRSLEHISGRNPVVADPRKDASDRQLDLF